MPFPLGDQPEKSGLFECPSHVRALGAAISPNFNFYVHENPNTYLEARPQRLALFEHVFRELCKQCRTC